MHECEERLTRSLPSSCPVAPVVRRRVTLLACGRLTTQVLGGAVERVEDSGTKTRGKSKRVDRTHGA